MIEEIDNTPPQKKQGPIYNPYETMGMTLNDYLARKFDSGLIAENIEKLKESK